MQFSTFEIFRNLPLRTSSKLNFMGDQIPLLRQTHQQGNPQGELESSLETARFPRRYAGHFEVACGTHWQGGEVTFKWTYAVLTCSPLKIGIVGRQACSLFGGKLPFFWGEVAVLVLGRVTFQLVCFNKIHEGAQGTTSKNFSWLPTSKTNIQ